MTGMPALCLREHIICPDGELSRFTKRDFCCSRIFAWDGGVFIACWSVMGYEDGSEGER
jgi:hypothetical protein